MNNNLKFKSSLEKKSKLCKRRGVTDIITTMLLMGITVTGASTLTYFVNDSFVSGNLATASSLDTATKSIQLLAYDTRDSSTLLQIPNLNNYLEQKLCGVSCISFSVDEEARELLAEERRAESESQVTRREEEQLLTIERNSNPGTQPATGAMSADPSDYAVAPDGSIIVAGAETLGHLADWLGVRAQRLRELNGMKPGQALSAGRRLKLDLSVVDATT